MKQRLRELAGLYWGAMGAGRTGARALAVRCLNLVLCLCSLCTMTAWNVSTYVGCFYCAEGSSTSYVIDGGWLILDSCPPGFPHGETVTFQPQELESPFTLAYRTDEYRALDFDYRTTQYSLPWLTMGLGSFPVLTLVWFLWRQRGWKPDVPPGDSS